MPTLAASSPGLAANAWLHCLETSHPSGKLRGNALVEYVCMSVRAKFPLCAGRLHPLPPTLLPEAYKEAQMHRSSSFDCFQGADVRLQPLLFKIVQD